MNLTSASITIHVLCGALLAFLAVSEIAKFHGDNSKIKRFEPLVLFLSAILSTIAIIFYGRPGFIEQLKNKGPIIHITAPVLLLYCLAISSFMSIKINPSWEKARPYLLLAFFLSFPAIASRMADEERHVQIISHLFIALPGIIYCIIYMLPFSQTQNSGKIKAILLLISAFQLFFYKEAPNSFGEKPVLSFSTQFQLDLKMKKDEKNTDKKRPSDKPGSGLKK